MFALPLAFPWRHHPLSVEKVLLSEEPTPDDFTEELQGGAPNMNMLPGFTTLENYPNPMVNSMACRRWGMEVSFVCDPGTVEAVLQDEGAVRINHFQIMCFLAARWTE